MRRSTFSELLGLDLRRPRDRFKWLLASMLFAKRISHNVATATFRRFEEESLDTPEAILEAGWDRLVAVLDSGGYTRYDYSTASTLLDAMARLKDQYGSVEGLYEGARNPIDLERRLKTLKGVGPVGVNIFLRELRGIWTKADPEPSRIASQMARVLGLPEEALRKPRVEAILVRLYLDCCKTRKCADCPAGNWCKTNRKLPSHGKRR